MEKKIKVVKKYYKTLDNENIMCNFSFEELRYMLVMLTEGQDKINCSKAFEGFQNGLK